MGISTVNILHMDGHVLEIRITRFPNGKYQYDLYRYANYPSSNKLVLLSCVDTMYETHEDALNSAKEHLLAGNYNIDKKLIITNHIRVPDNKIYSIPIKYYYLSRFLKPIFIISIIMIIICIFLLIYLIYKI